jgi:hypothetical protein
MTIDKIDMATWRLSLFYSRSWNIGKAICPKPKKLLKKTAKFVFVWHMHIGLILNEVISIIVYISDHDEPKPRARIRWFCNLN